MNVFKWILVATDVIGVIRGGHLAPAPDRKTAPKRDRVTVQKAGRGVSSHSQPQSATDSRIRRRDGQHSYFSHGGFPPPDIGTVSKPFR